MALRARPRDPGEHSPPEQHVVLGHWEPGRIWRVICEEKVLAESSNPDDSGMAAAMERPGATLQRSYVFVPSVVQWHPRQPPYPEHIPAQEDQ